MVTSANYTNANVSSAFAANALFGIANFTSSNGTTEANSTFKCPYFVWDSPSLLLGEWFKRTLYQPQNRSLVGYWKLDGSDLLAKFHHESMKEGCNRNIYITKKS